MPSHMQVQGGSRFQGFDDEPRRSNAERPPRRRGIPVWAFILALVLGLVAGGLVGFFFPKQEVAYLQGKTSLTAEELDATVGSYVSGGAVHAISARQALEATASLESQQNADGTYPMPAAESVLNVARNQVLQAAVEAEGIEPTPADIESYRQQVFGSGDIATLAQDYSMTEDQFNQLLAEGAGVELLYEKIVGEDTEGAQASIPELPPAPAEGKEGTPTAEYGAYIVGLLGDNWDSAQNTWANHDNPYYAAMGDDVFSADGATYDQAMEAYYVAYGVGSEENAPGLAAWDEYMKGLLAGAQITIGEMVQ